MIIIFSIKNKKESENYLDYIPVKNSEFIWKYDENNIIIIEMTNKGIYDKIAQKMFKAPKKSEISLDEYGSFIWEFIDGKNTIFDISQEISKKFGKNAEPLFNRIVKFFQILLDNKFITFKNKR